MESHREDRKETAQGQVSQDQGSTTEDNRNIVNREDRKQTAQGQVSHKARFHSRRQLKYIPQRR